MAATRTPLVFPGNGNNETESSASRLTREGKRITYKLTVAQQPERARACGAGAKSSADRRPVDPPPVVELRVLESDPNDELHQSDVTFAYNANFFLFATLESIRPVNSVRGSTAQSCHVLTGVPVAGVAYLDRPSQAGYFIFPDLSVRHEGHYRVDFHLYEEIKDPKDADEDAPLPPPQTTHLSHPGHSKPTAPQNFLNFRLDVKSSPFTVYSAKKFPGLSTSTSLSRIIAEQGCRVRIRRDVRMRRRGAKRHGEEFDYEDDRLYSKPSRYTTPDPYAQPSIERPRSTSNSTVEHPFSYPLDAQQQRPSGPEYGLHYQQPYQRLEPPAPPASSAAAPPPPHRPSLSSHLSFGPSQTPYPASQLPPAPQPVAPPTTYPSSHSSYLPAARNMRNGSDYESVPMSYPFPTARAPSESPAFHHQQKPALPPLLLEPSKPLQYQTLNERRSSDPNAYQSFCQSPASRSQTPSNIMPSLPPFKALSGELGASSSQSLSSIPSSPSIESTFGKRSLYETAPSVPKRSHAESFGRDDYPAHNAMGSNAATYPNTRRKLSDANYGGMYYKDPRSSMEYKRADGKVALKIHPTPQ